MDKIFIVSILVTFVGFLASAGSASTTDFQDALTNIDDKCMTKSVLASNPCSTEKAAVSSANDLTTACPNLSDYETCLDRDCEKNTDLDNIKAEMDTICGPPVTATKAALDDELNKVDGKCMTKSVPVPTPCSDKKLAVETPFKASDLHGACTNLPAYKTCLEGDCDHNTDLDNFIATMETTCSINNFLDVLNTIDNQCKNNSKAVTAPCAASKTEVDTHLNSGIFTNACKKLPGYKMCLLINCDSSTDLSNSISKMENTCDMSPSEVTDLQGVLNIIDSLCTKNSVAVAKPCPTEKQEMDTQLQSDSLTEACKELPDYKTCLLRDCDKAKNLTRSIDIMEDKCGSGFMKISVSMLTLFLAAIVNFL